MSPNEGYTAGIAKRSAKDRLGWALKGAPMRSRDLRLSPIGAVAEGRKLRESITVKMLKAGLDPEEAVVVISFAEPDLSIISPRFEVIRPDTSPEAELGIVKRHLAHIPIGFLVAVWDKAEGTYKGNIFIHARPLLIDPKAIALNDQALRVYTKYVERLVRGEGPTKG